VQRKVEPKKRIRPKSAWQVHVQKTIAAGGTLIRARNTWSKKFQRPKANAIYFEGNKRPKAKAR
jgi:hypothetical protein